MTDAPAPSDARSDADLPTPMDPADADLNGDVGAALASFREQMADHESVAASVVQDCLLDLWSSLPEGDSRAAVERWLVETLERSLYAVADVDARLASVMGD